MTRTLAALALTVAALATGATQASARSAPTGFICYQAHVQNIGWMDWNCDGEWAGTRDRALNLEAVRIHVNSGTDSFKVCAKAHRSNYGWDDHYECASNGHDIQIGTTGTIGYYNPMEAMRVYFDVSMGTPDGNAYVRNIGWLPGPTFYNYGGTMEIGTTGRGIPMESFWIKSV
ncbi:hypothetical protein [Streptomyces sp. VRA16 Mangrove soil]|uniref:hypothetical protein n=1 Tax=Streptomyces sp. VRA16 Mangrove soil TaxID=2817434 RepID=UPI001A9F564C|nr:hypothetical protein [Streptomyces sp. VRA16 Mangrove soil]MBO1331398.1 hypothetical protein [Streptomyces sp. VRA16 Mangrove soil]